jgi:O-antigen/teichoic acid export membrane protein
VQLKHLFQGSVKKVSVIFILRIFGAILGLGFQALLARLLGAEKTGIYFLALTFTTTGMILSRVGLDNFLLRSISKLTDQKDLSKISLICRRSIEIAVYASIFYSLTIIVSADWISKNIFTQPQLTNPLRIMAFSILPGSLLALYGEMLKAVREIERSTFVQVIGMPIFCLSLGGPLIYSGSIEGASIAYVFASISVCLISLKFWQGSDFFSKKPILKDASENLSTRKNFSTRSILKDSFPFFWIALLSLLMNSVDTILLGIWVDAKVVGIYGIITRISTLCIFILVAVNSVFAPEFASLYARKDIISLEKLVQKATRIMIVLTLPIFISIFAFSSQILSFFGADYISGASALIIVTIGQFINVATGSVGCILMMTGHEKLMQHNVIFSLILNVGLNIFLIPRYGLNGAAISSSISLILMNLVSAALVHKKLSILTFPVYVPSFLKIRPLA